jgi:hypothetical protein
MARTLILAAETPLAAGIGNSTSVGNATVVRVLNDSGSTVVLHVQDSSFSGIGSITMLNNTSELIEKKASDIIYGIGGALKVAKVGFTG